MTDVEAAEAVGAEQSERRGPERCAALLSRTQPDECDRPSERSNPSNSCEEVLRPTGRPTRDLFYTVPIGAISSNSALI